MSPIPAGYLLMLRILIALLFSLSAGIAARTTAESYSVPREYGTIQIAIDACSDGDTVLVGPGIYTGVGNRDLNFRGTQIVLLSIAGAELTTIDCQSLGAGLSFSTGESSAARVEGFTIRNASAGGIVCLAAGPAIVDCVIVANSPSGIICNQASPTISGCVIAGNESSGAGAGIYCYSSSSPAIVSCIISGNRAATRGGGIYCSTSSPFIVATTISRNDATEGGGICCHSASFPTLEQSILWGNCAGGGHEAECAFGCLISFTCCAVNRQGVQGDAEYNGRQVSVDPRFCDIGACWSGPTTGGDYTLAADSPCLPGNNPCNALIGALGQGCVETPIAWATWGSLKSGFRR